MVAKMTGWELFIRLNHLTMGDLHKPLRFDAENLEYNAVKSIEVTAKNLVVNVRFDDEKCSAGGPGEGEEEA